MEEETSTKTTHLKFFGIQMRSQIGDIRLDAAAISAHPDHKDSFHRKTPLIFPNRRKARFNKLNRLVFISMISYSESAL